MKVVGVDPGGRDTGVLLRSRDAVERVAVIHLPDEHKRPTREYVLEVVDEVAIAVDQGRSPTTGRDPIVALEDINDPSWWIDGEAKPLNPGYLIGVSMVFGAVLLAFPVVVVPPGGHGSRMLPGYPPEIVGGPHNPRWPHAEPKGKGVLRHARSAWDIAQAGLLVARATAEGTRR